MANETGIFYPPIKVGSNVPEQWIGIINQNDDGTQGATTVIFSNTTKNVDPYANLGQDGFTYFGVQFKAIFISPTNETPSNYYWSVIHYGTVTNAIVQYLAEDPKKGYSNLQVQLIF